jgi:hypothetical protein
MIITVRLCIKLLSVVEWILSNFYCLKELIRYCANHAFVFLIKLNSISFTQLLKDDAGNCPLHYACKLGHITLTRILMDHSGGRRALVILNNTEQKPIDICANNYIKSQVEGTWNASIFVFRSNLVTLFAAVMRKHRIFVPPRISLLDRS